MSNFGFDCEVRWLIKNGFSYLDFWCMRSALVIFMYEFNQEKKYNSQFTFDLLSEVIMQVRSRIIISLNYSLIRELSVHFFLFSCLKTKSNLVLKIFATVPSYTSTKAVSGVSSDGRTLFLRPGRKVYFGL